MELKEHLEILAKREKSKVGNVLAGYEVKDWTDGRLDKLIDMGMLKYIEDAITIKCPCCSKGCPVDPVKGTANDGTVYYEVLCEIEGSCDVEPIYLKQLQITKKIRKFAKKKKDKKPEKKFQPWTKSGDACFVIDGNKIMFHYKDTLRNLLLSAESNTYRLIRLLAGGSLQASEIKAEISPGTTNKASKIVDYANKLLNEKILMVGFTGVPPTVEFIKRNRFDSYSFSLKIHLKKDFDELQWK